jgi:cysteine desulfurase/selenocysteine lyase
MNPTDFKKHFPFFIHNPEVVYLDAAATALKPASVILAEKEYYETLSSNIARGSYPLAEETTERFEQVRSLVATFINAKRTEEIIFTSGTTASINLAAALLAPSLTKEHNIVITAAEHHANYLPWKELCKRTGAELRIVPVQADGTLDKGAFTTLVDEYTFVVAMSAISNVLGLINPVQDLIREIRKKNAHTFVVVDAAQAVGHMPVDVQDWDADFLAFSGHKVGGPTGTGVLFGKYDSIKDLAPVIFGGGMVLDACAEEPLYKEVPYRFEAGTPNIAGVLGLGAALQFVQEVGVVNIHAHEQRLALLAEKRLKETFEEDITIVAPGTEKTRSGIVSFVLTGVHPHDVAYLLGQRGICVRAGLQCAAPLHEALELGASTRLSFSIVNQEVDIEKLITALKEVKEKMV